MAHKKNKEKVEKVKAPKQPTLQEMCPVRALVQQDIDQFKMVTQLSNACAAVIEDISKKEQGIQQLRVIAKQIKNGDISGPLMQEVLPHLWAPQYKTENITKRILDQVDAMELTVKIARGQLPHRHDEYVDSLILFRDKLNKMVGTAKVSNLSEQRSNINKGEEKIIFEKNFDDFEGKEKTKQEIKKALQK